MKISYLEEFIEVAYCLNYSKAAKKIGTSQSSISKHVQALEKQYGVPLFERDTTSVALTSFGIALFQEAVGIVEAYKRFEAKMNELANQYKSSLIVGGMHYNPKVMRLLKEVQHVDEAEGRLIPLQYKSTLADPLVTSLKKREIDIAITITRPSLLEDEDLHSVPLFSDPLLILMSRDHPLATRESLRYADLENQTLLKPSGSYFVLGNEAIENLIASHGLECDSRIVFIKRASDFLSLDFEGGVTFVESGLAGTIASEHELVALPITEDDAQFPIVAACLASNRGAVSFVDALRAAASETGGQEVAN